VRQLVIKVLDIVDARCNREVYCDHIPEVGVVTLISSTLLFLFQWQVILKNLQLEMLLNHSL